MECLVTPKLVLLAVLVIALGEPFSFALSTTKCDHNQIVGKLKATINCEIRLVNNILKSKLTPSLINNGGLSALMIDSEWCELLNNGSSCVTDHLGTCFNETLSTDFVSYGEYAVYRAHRLKCNEDYVMNYADMRNMRRKYGDLIRNPENLAKLFKFDQNCTVYPDLAHFFGAECPQRQRRCRQRQCFESRVEPISRAIGMYIYPYRMNQGNTKPSSIPICQSVVGILNTCMNDTSCLSQQEITLIHDLLSTLYQVLVDLTVQEAAEFGSMSNLMELPMDFYAQFRRLPQNFKDKWTTVMDMVVDDYQVRQI